MIIDSQEAKLVCINTLPNGAVFAYSFPVTDKTSVYMKLADENAVYLHNGKVLPYDPKDLVIHYPNAKLILGNPGLITKE